MINTVLCDLLCIKYPILQGGMAWISDANLACSVSNAGGLGIIAAGNAPASYIKEQIEIAKIKTDKPFGVNIMLMSPYADEIAELVINQGVSVVTTGAGNPSKYMKKWLQAGIKVIPVVPSVGIAKWVEKSGATAIIAEGCESGGHIGELSTLPLVAQVVDAVKVPVIAAGGIGDGRGLAAALMLGAVGVQLGTRFLVANECNVHENYKNSILKAKDIDTIVSGKRLSHPVRSLKNAFSKAFFSKEYDMSVTNEELEKFGTGALRLAAVEGDLQNGCFMAGQIAGMIKSRQSTSEIINQIINEAENSFLGASKWVK